MNVLDRVNLCRVAYMAEELHVDYAKKLGVEVRNKFLNKDEIENKSGDHKKYKSNLVD